MEWLKKCWAWIAGVLGAMVFVAVAYFTGRGKRKGDIELEVAIRELDKANKEHDAASAKVEAIKQKQIRLVGEIIAEKARRVEEVARAEGLTHEEVLERLRQSGDIAK